MDNCGHAGTQPNPTLTLPPKVFSCLRVEIVVNSISLNRSSEWQGDLAALGSIITVSKPIK